MGSTRIFGALLLLGLLASATVSPRPAQDPDAFLDAFPPGLLNGSAGDGLFPGEFRGTLSTSTRRGAVVLRWSWDPSLAFRGDTVEARSQEVLTCSFRPNAVAAVGTDRALVAGLDEERQEVVIELWHLSAPRVRRAAVLDDQGAVVGSEPSLAAAPHGDRVRIWSAPLAARGTVALMVQNQRRADQAFVLFAGSRTLESLDWSQVLASGSGQALRSVVAQVDPAPGVHTCAELADPEYDHAWSGQHTDPTVGDVYLLVDRSRHNVSPALLWKDTDRDGALDACEPVGTATPRWVQLGMRDRSSFSHAQGRER